VIEFEWDSATAQSNFRKHRVSFNEAVSVTETIDLLTEFGITTPLDFDDTCRELMFCP
jgi:uncharacterized DUF497 family protein